MCIYLKKTDFESVQKQSPIYGWKLLSKYVGWDVSVGYSLMLTYLTFLDIWNAFAFFSFFRLQKEKKWTKEMATISIRNEAKWKNYKVKLIER